MITILFLGSCLIIRDNWDWYCELIKKLWLKVKPFLTFKTFISFGIAWMITNGWGYLFIIFGKIFDITWMYVIGLSYISFLWLPGTPEKLITIPLAIFIHEVLFHEKCRFD